MSSKKLSSIIIAKAGWYTLIFFSVLVWLVVVGDVVYYVVSGGI